MRPRRNRMRLIGAGAGRGPWLTRPGKGTTADWPGRDPGDAAATRADDKAGALPSRSGRDDPPAYAGRDEAATRAGDGAGRRRSRQGHPRGPG